MKARNNPEAGFLNWGGRKLNGRFGLLRQSIFSMSFAVGGLAAGGLLEHYLGLIIYRGWILAVYPIVLTARGALNGILAGRLSAGLHVELIKPSLRRNTRNYYAVASALAALSVILSFILSLFSIFLTGSPINELPIAVSVCITTQAVASLLTIPLTSVIGFLVFKRGLDPDTTLYPVSSTVADIWATTSYLVILITAFNAPHGSQLIHIMALATVVTVAAFFFKFRKEPEYWRTLKEASLTAIAVSLIATFSGYILSSIRLQLKNSPGVLLVYPALMDTLGDAAVLFSSISTTRLFLGSIESDLLHIIGQKKELAQLWVSATPYYVLYGFSSYLLSGNISRFFASFLSFQIAFPVTIFLASSAAFLTFKKGLDPDNFAIPIEAALTDMNVTILTAIFLMML